MALDHDSDYFLELQTNTGWGQILASFTRWCAPHKGDHTLDVGCGPGLLPALFAKSGASALGCDSNYSMFADPLHPDLLVADGSCLPFPDKQFDLVTASNVLYLHPQPEVLLSEMERVTRSGGAICLLNPSENMTVTAATSLADENRLEGLARETLINFAQRAENHFRWTPDDLVNLSRTTGLKLTETALRMGTGLVRYARATKNNI
jgi:ubiquinone/menaquinone biosynthesis C-methylase UbiE